MASFIELIAKIKQKNNGAFKLVDAQDVECEDGKGLDEVLNEKLDKNQGVENAGKTMIVGDDGNLVVGDSSPKNVYTKEEVDYLLDDKMDKPYVPIEITDNATITDALEGNFKIDKIKGNTYQNVETDIVPTPNRPVPINSRKVKANGEYVELRSLKETGNLFDINFIKLWGNYSDGMTILDDGTVKVTNNDATLWPIKTKSITIPKSANYTIKYDFETISGGANSGWIALVNMSNDNQKIFSTSGKTLYLDAGDYYVRFYRGQGATDVENNIVQYSNIVLVEGTSAPSTYVAPTVKDYKIVDHTTKTSKIIRNVLEIDANNIKAISHLNNEQYISFQLNISGVDVNTLPKYKLGYCSLFLTEEWSGVKDYEMAWIARASMGISISKDRNISDVEQFLQFVKEKDIKIFAKAATPTEESITYLENDTSEVGYSWQDTTSPSPTIKSEVKPVEKIDILKTGKNLFDIDGNVNTIVNNIQGAKNSVQNGILTSNYNSNNEALGGQLIKIENGKQYTISLNVISIGTGNAAYIAIYRNGKPIYSPNTKVGAWKTTITATVDEILLAFGTNNGTGAQFTNIQIEVGDTPTSYEPYAEQRVNITPPQPLYQNDIANIESGEYEYNDVTYVLDDKTPKTIQFGTTREKTQLFQLSVIDIFNNNDIWCDKLKNDRNKDEELFTYQDGTLYISIYKNRLETVDVAGFKKWLKDNPLTFVGSSSSPTTQPIPEEDLTKLKSLKTNAGVNNIFVGGEVKPTIEARYPRDLALVQQQLEQKILLISDSLIDTQAKVLLQGGN